jgi:DNA-binding HxlR family transcriptional regulator
VPSRVEYSLTPRGWKMTSLLVAVYEWGLENLASAKPATTRRPARLTLVPDDTRGETSNAASSAA